MAEETVQEKETARVEAFSDGVFAISITLLVLDLKVPRGLDAAALRAALIHAWPSYTAFLTSFLTIGIMWLNHHRIFGLMRRVDYATLVLNGLLLLGVSVVPFPTSLVAEYLGRPGARVAIMLYTAVGLYIALAFTALWRYVLSPERHPALMRVAPDHPTVRTLQAHYRWGPVVYLVVMGIAFWSPTTGLGLCLGMTLFFLLPMRPAR